MTDKLPELLSPCGSPEALDAAISGGADAVYLGGTMFNARMNAKNFDRAALAEAVAKCHSFGVRMYVTLNTLLFDRELKSALEYAGFLYETGADALIVTDMGLISLIRRYIPEMELHASTQVTVHSAEAALRLKDIGFKRVVCAREMSSEDIRMLVSSGVEVEMFVHGAICVSCSGQCLMSSMLGGRSGNRGECAQPCRMPYNGSYPISLKDMCLARHIPKIIESGVASLKIEGRMKSPAYVYGVTSAYRRLLDERRAASDEEFDSLAKLFSRGGFTDGYYTKTIGASMLGVRSNENIAESKKSGQTAIPKAVKRLPVIELSRGTVSIPDSAGMFSRGKPLSSKPIFTARFRTASQIPATDYFEHIYLPLDAFCGKRVPDSPAPDGVVIPPVIFDSEREQIKRMLEEAVKKGASHALIGNIGHFSLADEFGLIPHGDFRLNVTNSKSADYYASLGISSLLVSPELNLPQMRDICFSTDNTPQKGAVVYGRLPLMLLERRTGLRELRDSRGVRFPVFQENGRELIYNSVPIYMADQPDRLKDSGIAERHFIFTTEDRGEILRIIYAYQHKVIPKDPVKRIK